jgi:hypothetical protein
LNGIVGTRVSSIQALQVLGPVALLPLFLPVPRALARSEEAPHLSGYVAKFDINIIPAPVNMFTATRWCDGAVSWLNHAVQPAFLGPINHWSCKPHARIRFLLERPRVAEQAAKVSRKAKAGCTSA